MDFLQVVEGRKSIRKYKEERLDKDLVDKVLDVAIKSPTGMNKQNRTYIVIQDDKILEDLANAIGQDLDWGDYNFFGAPCLILVSTPVDSTNALVDTGTAMMSLYLAATYYGLGSCWINQFKNAGSDEYKDILASLGIGEDRRVLAGMVLGYADEDPDPKEKSEPVSYFI